MLEQVDGKKQVQILLSLVTYLLNKRKEETPERSIIKLLALDKHTQEGHAQPFYECEQHPCASVTKILAEAQTSEVTIDIAALKKLGHYRLHYGSKLAGTVSAWLEEEALIKVVGATNGF